MIHLDDLLRTLTALTALAGLIFLRPLQCRNYLGITSLGVEEDLRKKFFK